MAQIRKSFVRETTTTIGVGSVTLSGARSPGRTFASVMANGDTCDYSIVHSTLNEFETGVGTFGTGGVLARTTVIESSNSNSAVNFSAGTKNVDLVVNSTRYNTFDAYATTSVQGQIQLASVAGTLAATDTIRAVTPQEMGIFWKAGTDNTGAATITMGDGYSFNLITSTTAITALVFTDDAVGRRAKLRFATIRTLTNNAAIAIIGGASITTAVGDTCEVESLGSGNFRVYDYVRTDGGTIAGALIRVLQVNAGTTSVTHSAGTRVINIRGVGAGGAGGGAAATSGAIGAGGGAGTYGERRIVLTSLSSTCVVPSGGAGSSAATGGSGSSTTFTHNGVTTTLPGGAGGTTLAGGSTAVPTAGGVGGGAATNADFSIVGQPGEAAVRTAALQVPQVGGGGADSPLGYGGPRGANGSATAVAGINATGFGSGGSGRLNGTNTTAGAGGNGAPGVWIVEEYA